MLLQFSGPETPDSLFYRWCFYAFFRASEGKHKVSEECQTSETGEGVEKIMPVHTPLFVLLRRSCGECSCPFG